MNAAGKELMRGMSRKLSRAWDSFSESGESATPLIAAARRGDTSCVEALLEQGANADSQDDRGETALHHAVRWGQVETVACLLAYGANHAIANKKGQTALSVAYAGLETLHGVRQRCRRFRSRASLRKGPMSRQAQDWVSELNAKGIVKISGLITPDELARMKREFEEFVGELDSKVAQGQGFYKSYDEESHWWPEDRAYVTNNAFKYSQQLVRFCCHEVLLEAASDYIGRAAFIQRGVAMRYLPNTCSDKDMFGWHHDLEEKRFKMLVLLTDVGPSDQYMSYVLGSHQLLHPYRMFRRNRCSLSYCQKHLGRVEITTTVGRAGDVFLFDSNGAHRGNRRPDAAVRDTFFVEYTADKSNIWGGDIDPELFHEIALTGPNPFAQLMAAEKKWTKTVARKTPSWIENLPQVETWL